MKIIHLTAENIKKLKVVDITPESDVVQITGKNGSGKTSVLDSIWWALTGTTNIQSQPIRSGETKAHIKLDLGDIVVTRKFTEKGSTLTVENAEGAKFNSPQKMLDDLIGHLSFDPLAFSKMDGKSQYSEIKRISNISVDIDELDRLNKADFDIRTNQNRIGKEYRTRAEGYKFTHAAMAAPIDVQELVQKLAQSSEHNATIDTRAANRAKLAQKILADQIKINEMTAEIERLRAGIVADEAKLHGAPELPEKISVEQLQVQINEANARNAEHARRIEQAEWLKKAKEAEDKSEALTAAMAERDKVKAEAIQNAEMPIVGLTLVDGQVLFDGVPFEQASMAQQIGISVAIAMAANPKLKVIRIKDGSLLDDDSMAMLADMAKDNDYQIWIERVDTSGKIGVVMEDGEVKGAH